MSPSDEGRVASLEHPWQWQLDSTAQLFPIKRVVLWAPARGPHFPSLRTLRAIRSLSCQPLVTLMSSVQARLTQALPTPRDSSPGLLLGPDWFDLVRQPVVSQALFSGDLEAHTTWLHGELRSCLGSEH